MSVIHSAGGGLPQPLLPDDVEAALVAELTRNVLSDVAPEELPVFDADPARWLKARDSVHRGRDAMLGFGAEALLTLIPFVVAAATAVLQLLGKALLDAATEVATDEMKPMVAGWLRRLLHRGKGDGGGAAPMSVDDLPPLSTADLARIYEAVHRICIDCGLEDPDATLVAQAVVAQAVKDCFSPPRHDQNVGTGSDVQ